MNRKYEFTGREKTLNDNGKEVVVKQIRAIRRIPLYDVEEGDVGGWIESEENLSHDGDCWVKDDAVVYGNALVSGRSS